jgi:proteic killer suppression protein
MSLRLDYTSIVYSSGVIQSFADAATEDIFQGRNTPGARRRLPRELWGLARRKLTVIDGARDLRDIAVVPGLRLEALSRDLAGRYSVRINDQYRITFRYAAPDIHDVWCGDYHS